jgi:hypothetical protein
MALDLAEIKRLHDKAYQAGQVTRQRAADDMCFYFITQWSSELLDDTQLTYRGEFNILKKAGRQILSDLAENPVQVDFEPVDETRDDAAELLDGLYRTDDNANTSLNAYANAMQETVVCGVGAWMLFTRYESNRAGNKRQVIDRWPIFEANNSVFWDPGARLMDKSDADYVSVLCSYSEDGYKKLVKELTGEEVTNVAESFKHPEQSYTFPWYLKGKTVYVAKFYHREKVDVKILTMLDPFGQTLELAESELSDVMDEMLDEGYTIESEREIEQYQVTEYICSGCEILESKVIAGQHIPIIPVYGERAYVEGEEHYEGVTRLAKDPQMLRNFQMSYLADIVSQSPREKPIFLQEQIAGFEDYYSMTGADNNYAYLLQNRKALDGTDLPIGPIAMLPAPQVPPALAGSLELSRQAVEDVANPGIPQDIADPDLSGKAVLALERRLDMQSMVYQEHYKHAKRRDGQVYASMAAAVYDVPRKIKMTLPDGTTKESMVMQTVIDKETGDLVTLNDLSNAEFEVYSQIGASYSSKKEQTIDRLQELISTVPEGDPLRKALYLKMLTLMDGVNFDDIREYANKQLVLQGFKTPETDEEKQLLEESQKNQAPDAAMVLAMAEDKKGEAQLLEQQRKGIEMQLEAANEKLKRLIESFDSQTKRFDVQVNAAVADAQIENTRTDTFAKQIEAAANEIPLRNPYEMSTEELFSELQAG